ncbi:MAG: N-acetylmuramoyl-L-alanine amidase [Candidatus Sericytochromatia bacterium]|nr:N-acetylmuramoyl-L-alanine amidase [Candidatus Sericytochromatia bacterium]
MRKWTWLMLAVMAVVMTACASRVAQFHGDRPEPAPPSRLAPPSDVPPTPSVAVHATSPEICFVVPPGQVSLARADSPAAPPPNAPRRPAAPPPRRPTPAIRPKPQALRLPAIAELLSPNCNERSRRAITAIVLHHTASPDDALGIARYFFNPESRVSSHYIVGRNGSLVRCVPDFKRAWHAGPSIFRGVPDVNEYSIGIEICNRGDGAEVYPPNQVATVCKLVANLAKQYGIPLAHVTRHRDVAVPKGIKVDPSNNFDFLRVIRTTQSLLGRRDLMATR